MTTEQATETQPRQRKIALVAHDRRKHDLQEWARFNRGVLARLCLYATGTTGRLLHEELGLPVTCFRSGPLGGDQQIGARIADGEIDLLVFLSRRGKTGSRTLWNHVWSSSHTLRFSTPETPRSNGSFIAPAKRGRRAPAA